MNNNDGDYTTYGDDIMLDTERALRPIVRRNSAWRFMLRRRSGCSQ